MKLFTRDWWKGALTRALRTAIVIALPYVGGTFLADIPYVAIASAAGLGFIASLLTSLTGIAEADGGQVSWWYAFLERVLKTFAQSLLAGLGSAIFVTDVQWPIVLQAAVIAAVGSALLAFLTKLPEAALLPSPVQLVAPTANSSTIDTSTGATVVDDGIVAATQNPARAPGDAEHGK